MARTGSTWCKSFSGLCGVVRAWAVPKVLLEGAGGESSG